ncbi:hypothetical protein [Tardiphaga sp. P9-11]|uniref:hypothetical protein n=1 Tax=Tardiphaga sp. P9-11 TaxID=2024614 RepID=UPI00156259A3|nr:hypothetical protein [Tardiphaga sp. P9-11]
MIIRRLIVPLTMAVFAMQAVEVHAQGAFPAPLPGNSSAAPANSSPFPPVNGAPASASPFPPINGSAAAPSAFPSGGAAPLGGGGFGAPPQQQAGPPGGEDCMKGFLPLRQDAEKKGAAIKAASERRAPPDEACKLITSFSQTEVKMIKYIEANAQKCGIPANVGEQMKTGHKNTEGMRQKVCSVASQQQRGGGPAAAPRLSDVLGSSASLPEANNARKSGGTTFDTLNGNVLTR